MSERGTVKSRGFTLIELIVVIAIVGILAAIAYPSYVEHVNKVRRAEAQTALVELAARLQEFYIDQTPPTYAGANLEGEGANPIFPSEAPLEGNTKYYDLSITAQDARSFTIEATPNANGAMAGDFTFSLDARGAKRHGKGSASQDGWP